MPARVVLLLNLAGGMCDTCSFSRHHWISGRAIRATCNKKQGKFEKKPDQCWPENEGKILKSRQRKKEDN
jgi:hypothetical protein